MLAPLALLAALASALIAARRRRRRRPSAAHAVIVSPRRSTVIARDGGVRSAQSARMTLAAVDLDRLWIPANLENLARTYWRFLTRVTLGVIRVRYDEDGRSVVLLRRPLTLLRFELPRYEMEPDRGSVTWQIRDGLLVARNGRGSGYLRIEARRLRDEPDVGAGRAAVRIEVEVANFYPSIAVGFSVPVYEMTQSVLHVLVTHAFLRSLAHLRLDRSRIGALATREPDEPAQTAPEAARPEPSSPPIRSS